MKNFKLTSIYFICFFSWAFSQGNLIYENLLESNINGNVKTLIETKYFSKEHNGNFIKDRLIGKDFSMFNAHRKPVENKHYNANGLLSTTQYKYDQNDNLIAYIKFGENGELIRKETYKYDGFNNEIEKSVFNYNGKLEFKIISDYDKNNKILSKNKIGPYGKKKTVFKNYYNDKGYLTEEHMYDLLGGLVKIVHTFDSFGRKTETKLYNAKGKLEEKQSFIYDEKNNLVENIVYNEPGFMPQKTSFLYDQKSNLIEKKRYNTDGQLLEKDTHEYTYDSNNNLIEEKHSHFYLGTNESNESSKYLTFDRKGNWTEKLFFENGKLYSIIERVFEYYAKH